MNNNRLSKNKNSGKEDLIQQGKRIESLRKTLGNLTQKEFGELLKGSGKPISDATISKYELGQLAIAQRAILELVSSFNVSKEWLLNGNGEMFLPTKPNDDEGNNQMEGEKIRLNKAIGVRKDKAIPVFNETGALAGNEFEMNMEPNSEPTEYKSMSNLDLLEEADAVLRVWGSSMTPNYPSGSELALEVNYDKFFVPGEVYVIETRSNRVFKRIYNSSREGYIKCVSDNTIKHETGPLTGEYFYPPFEIPLADIIKKFDILGLQKRNKNSKVYYRQTNH